MSFRNVALTAALGLSMASAPVMAQTSQAASLSVAAAAAQDTATTTSDEGGFAGFNQDWIIPGIIIIGVIVVLVLIYTGDDDDDSISV